MKNQQRELNGLSIHGQSLKVSFKGDGVLTSSIEIERSRQTPSEAFFLVFFLSGIVGTVALLQVTKRTNVLSLIFIHFHTLPSCFKIASRTNAVFS